MASVTITGPVLDSTGAPATGLFVVEVTAQFGTSEGAYVSRTPYVVQVAGGELYLADGTSPWTQIVPPAGQAIKVFERLQPSGGTAASGTRVIQRTRVLEVPGDVLTVKYGELIDVEAAPSDEYTIPAYVQQVFENYGATVAARAAAEAAAASAAADAAGIPSAVGTAVAEQDIPGKVDIAVTTDLAGRDVVEGSDHRIPQIVETVRRVWGAPVDNDGNDPFAVYSDGRTFLDPHETVTIERKLHDVRRYLDLGADEQLPNDGILDAQPLIQRAVTALHAMYLIDGIPRQVYLPLGRWRLNTDINWYGCSGIGLVGAGRTSTTLLPYGPNPAIRGVLTSGYDGPDYYDCVFEDFTIDCANQTADPSGDSTKVKGIFIQRMIRAWFARVTILHSGATSFGVDFLKQSYFTDCYAIDAGRFITDRKSTGAGFGFATGLWEDESISLVNCISLNCHSHGIFVEKSTSRLSAYPEKPGGYKPIGLRVVNHYAAGCYDGFFASGATAPLLLNCVFAYNDFAGVLIDENTLTLDGDDITQIRGCLIYKNGNGIDPNTSAKFINSGGVVLRKTTGLSPKIEENVILENYGPGVRVYGSSAGPALAIRGNQILRNQESGILISSGTGPKRTVIEGNQIFDNGTNASATYRDGITFVNTILDHLVMVHNNVWDTRAAGSKTQQNGVQTTGTPLWTKPRVQDNNFDENAVASMGLSSNQSVTTFVTGNMV